MDNGGEVRSKFYDDENSLADMQKAVEDSENYESSMVLKRIVGTDEKEGEELEQDIENEHTIHENFIKNLKAMPNEVRSQDKKSVSDLVSLIIKKAKPTEISKTFKKLTRAGKDYVMGVISTADKDPLLQKGKVLNTIVNEEFEITRLSKIDGRTKQFKEKLRSLEYRKQFELDELTLKKAKAVDPDTEVFVNFKKQNNKYPFAANNLKFSKGAGFIFHRPVTNRAKQLPIPGNFTTGAWVRIKDLPGLIVRDSAKATANARILKKFLNAIPGISIDEVSLATLGQQAKSGKAAAALFVLYFVAKGVEGLLDKGIYVKRIERGAQSDKKTVVALGNTPMRESTQIDEIAPIAVGAAKVIGGAIATAGAMKGGEAIVKKKERQERIKRWRGRLRHARMQLKAAKTESDKKIARERINNLQDRLDEID